MVEFPRYFLVTAHTDFVTHGSTFVAIQGTRLDGKKFIPEALERGAKTIVIQENECLSDEHQELIAQKNASVMRVPNIRRALAELSALAYGYPAKKLKIIGVTGTKGKTTSVFLIEYLLRSQGIKTAMLSSVHNKILTTILPTQLTTQQPDYLQAFLQQCVLHAVDVVVMEVAAQALSLERVHGIAFDTILFTNFDQEHGEFYGSMQDYFSAKCKIFGHKKPDTKILLNRDNAWCAQLLGKNPDFSSYSCADTHAEYYMSDLSYSLLGIKAQVHCNGNVVALTSPLIGEFNAANILGALAVCNAYEPSLKKLVHSLATFHMVPGRLELYCMPNGARAFIDYAHNPSSFSSVLKTLREFTDHLIVVCGAGGDRDAGKRPIMGALVAEYADVVFFTTDNPRSEDPAVIINNMVAGVQDSFRSKIYIELDRECAIKRAYECSRSTSIIALLGKGPDHYQLVKGQKLYFNEAEILQRLS
jgi:UDP-N-acetylmuramoyl-L-alanyl-D-glutamate--2,6-diaminopimelate ligase